MTGPAEMRCQNCDISGGVDEESPDPSDLTSIRDAIEALDRSILELLQRRRLLGERAARAKIAAAVPLRDPVREELVLQRAREAAVAHGLDAHQTERLYRIILDMSLSQQQAHLLELETVPLRVAFQGGEGSPDQLAAQRRYGGRKGGALLAGHATLADAVQSVRSGRADVAFLPLESSTGGSTQTFDLVADAGLMLSGEAYVQSASGDSTRFVEVGREPASCSVDAACKTSIVLSVEHRAGALEEILQVFARWGVSLTKLESRPVRGTPLRSRFFIDMEGHSAQRHTSAALDEIRGRVELRVLGSYPAAALEP
jgi:prephenate dehydratase/chorismate mutase